jgi:hypothetical protein
MPPQRFAVMPCGCFPNGGEGPAIIFCPVHAKAGQMASLLDAIRTYFLEDEDGLGEGSPIAKRIDQVLPRLEKGRAR